MDRYKQITDETQAALATTRLALFIIEALERDIRRRGKALLILPGGSSPRFLISELGRLHKDWRNIIVTTTDERCVPLESEHSNAGQIRKLAAGIDPLCLWMEDRPASVEELPWPATVCVLGMGLDGHVASLFTADDMKDTDGRLVRTMAQAEPSDRISFTMKSLVDAEHLILLVTGAKKKALYETALKGGVPETPLAIFLKAAGKKLSAHVSVSGDSYFSGKK